MPDAVDDNGCVEKKNKYGPAAGNWQHAEYKKQAPEKERATKLGTSQCCQAEEQYDFICSAATDDEDLGLFCL